MADRPGAPLSATGSTDSEPSPAQHPDWFDLFLADRQTRKPSPATIKAYKQDFAAIASLVTNGQPAAMQLADITKGAVRSAFATFAETHEAATIRRCWSTWNVLCTFLYTAETIDANPMQLVGRPKLPKTLPKSLPRTAVQALLETVAQDVHSTRETDWPERDLAIILIGVLAGLRADEMCQANVGDIRTTADGAAVVQVKGKGKKERSVPIEAELLLVIETYLDSRAMRLPRSDMLRSGDFLGLRRWPARAPLFVGRDGERLSYSTLQSRIYRAFRRAGPDAQPVPGALIHGLRHTFATELAAADVNVYTLMKLLGHESMATSQRYVSAAGAETRRAAATNPLYDLIPATQSQQHESAYRQGSGLRRA